MGRRVLVVGGGGREHALLWKLAQGEGAGGLWCAPGNAGTAELAETLPLAVTDVDGLAAAVERLAIELVVVGPEAALAAGLVDRLEAIGVPVCGPRRGAARIETSKAWAKELMRQAGVPTARSVVVDDRAAGVAALDSFGLPVVVKADGLAAGKGVVVAATRAEAEAALGALLADPAHGTDGGSVLIEECLVGEEVSVLALTDGERVCLLPPARDHKRALDGDRGPNTGGMGAYAPAPSLDAAAWDDLARSVFEPTVRRLAKRGDRFRGVLYAGLMLTDGGPRVIEFNARFGDPETQVVLPTLDGDLGQLLHAVATGTLSEVPEPAHSGAAVGIVLASGGYPASYPVGLPIHGLEDAGRLDDVLIFHAGTRREGDAIVTAGGRVLTVVGLGKDVRAARDRAYDAAERITFEGRHLRTDIAARELA